MHLPVLFAALSVVVGALMGLGSSGRALGVIRAFAIGASLVTVVGGIVPEAIESAGPVVLVALGAGLVLPLALERTLRHRHHRPDGACEVPTARAEQSRIALELGYAGLALHQVGDGVALAAFSGPAHEGHAHFDVFVSIAGHTVPVVAAAVMAFAARSGTRSGAIRAAGLGAAVLAGLAISALPGASSLLTAEFDWISTFAGGLLLHVVLHGVDFAHRRSIAGRKAELVAFVIGCALPLLIGHDHGAGA
jgi:hypothetical protein